MTSRHLNEDSAAEFLKNFADPEAVAAYADNVGRFLPGAEALHRMAAVLISEKVPQTGRILVLGAGGGLELRALAAMRPGWSFLGVDPAPEMLGLAERMLGAAMARVELVEGYIDDAPAGPFDAALCLLTLHFLAPPERERTVREIHKRLKPGAPFVAAHSSIPDPAAEDPGAKGRWLDRYAAYAVSSGADPQMAKGARDAIEASGIMLTPEEDLKILKNGGFRDMETFWTAFTWRGWIGHA